jgi:hypothetical protein
MLKSEPSDRGLSASYAAAMDRRSRQRTGAAHQRVARPLLCQGYSVLATTLTCRAESLQAFDRRPR